MVGCLLILNEWETRADMTKYEIVMLIIAILNLIINALALFKQK